VRELSLTILLGAGFESQEKSNCANQARTDNGGGSILRSLLSLRSEHPEQTNEYGNPAR
jgi:hypothetical protein